MIRDLKESIGQAVRATSVAALAAFSTFVVVCFLCAAAFVYVLERSGPVAACFTGAGIFAVVAAASGTMYLVSRRRSRAHRHEREAQPSPLAGMIADPMLLGVGMQAARAIGLKRLLPLLAIGGLALGLLASRNGPGSQTEAAE